VASKRGHFFERIPVNTASIKILIVDDHALTREALTTLLHTQSDLNVIGEAGNGREALTAYRLHQPDITLMDLLLPDMDGLEIMKTILCEYPDARFLVLSLLEGVDALAHYIGAKACLRKDIPCQQLFETIREVDAAAKMR
jgi:DNA-binding NarL/FixJ family response regulator